MKALTAIEESLDDDLKKVLYKGETVPFVLLLIQVIRELKSIKAKPTK